MMRWEYVVHTLNAGGVFSSGQINPREMQDVLNHYGQQGWELSSAFDTSASSGSSRLIVLTFKRPIEPIPAIPVR